jgi:hypothetical protein
MIGHFYQVRSQLENDLEKINKEEQNDIFTARKSLVIIRECCRQLSSLHIQCDFKNREEEIHFFKELKCYYYSQLFYHQDILEIETNIPNGDKKFKQDFLKEQLQKLNEHFSHNRFLYAYYRGGGTERDHQYFTAIRKYETKFNDQGREMLCEDDYSCIYDMLYARVISNDRLEKYLHKGIMKLEETEIQSQVPPITHRSKLEWTESKAALVELLYALYSSNCINNGKVDIKELVASTKYIFPNIEISDHYRIFIDLQNRKNNRTKFIDTLRTSLMERLDREE